MSLFSTLQILLIEGSGPSAPWGRGRGGGGGGGGGRLGEGNPLLLWKILSQLSPIFGRKYFSSFLRCCEQISLKFSLVLGRTILLTFLPFRRQFLMSFFQFLEAIYNDLSPILETASRTFSSILKVASNEFSSFSETVSAT